MEMSFTLRPLLSNSRRIGNSMVPQSTWTCCTCPYQESKGSREACSQSSYWYKILVWKGESKVHLENPVICRRFLLNYVYKNRIWKCTDDSWHRIRSNSGLFKRLWLPWQSGHFLTSLATASFLIRALLPGLIQTLTRYVIHEAWR